MVSDLVLNRFFTKSTFQNLVAGKEHAIFDAAIRHCNIDPVGKNYGTIISEIYRYLDKSYRNEYFYKNTLLNILLLGRHRPSTTTALTEVPIGKAKADFVLINGKAVVYEIKTELDNLERLEHQISEYYKAFRYVVVVTYPENYSVVEQYLSNPCVGIYVITKQGTISRKLVREPQEFTAYLDSTTIFQIMRKHEYENALIRITGSLPKTTSFQYYRACLSLFCNSLTVLQAQHELEVALKSRIRINPNELALIPRELKFIAYFSDMRSADYQSAITFLNSLEEEGVECTFQF